METMPGERGWDAPFLVARRLLYEEAVLTYWVLHTSDCPRAPERPIRKWPARGASRHDKQIAYASLRASQALRVYLNLGNEACALCKPGMLLRETIPEHPELHRVWALRGGA